MTVCVRVYVCLVASRSCLSSRVTTKRGDKKLPTWVASADLSTRSLPPFPVRHHNPSHTHEVKERKVLKIYIKKALKGGGRGGEGRGGEKTRGNNEGKEEVK